MKSAHVINTMVMDNRKWILFILIVLIILFLYRVRAILSPFIFAALIAYIAFPLVKIFEKRQVPRTMAILLVYLIFGTVIGLIFSFLIPQLAKELDDILKTLPEQTEMLEDGLDLFKSLQHMTVPKIIKDGFELLVNRIQILLEGLAGRLASFLVAMVSQIISLAVAPFLAFYLLRDMEKIKRRTFLSIPRAYRLTVYSLAKEMNDVLNGFIRGQLVNSTLVGLLIAAGLAIIGIKYALFIGILAGLFNIIPYFGPVIGFIPAFVLALAKSPMSVFWVLVTFVVANQIEANIIAPKFVGERVGLHPLAVIFAILAGGELMGISGMLVAVPVAGIVRILLNYVLRKLDRV